jgi:hypothetical protein
VRSIGKVLMAGVGVFAIAWAMTAQPVSAAGPEVGGCDWTPGDITDPLDGSVAPPATVDLGSTTYDGMRDITDVDDGERGLTGLPEDTSYLALDPFLLDPAQGTILVTYQPPPDIVDRYTTDHPGWTTFGDYAPPHYGFVFDTVGWSVAHRGAFELVATPGSSIAAEIFDGGTWHVASWTTPPDFDWTAEHEVGLGYGPAGLSVIVDCAVQAVDPYTGGVDPDAPWFLGQAPEDWPYGPHSLTGVYRDLVVLGVQPTEGSVGPVPVATPEVTAGPADTTSKAETCMEQLHQRYPDQPEKWTTRMPTYILCMHQVDAAPTQ